MQKKVISSVERINIEMNKYVLRPEEVERIIVLDFDGNMLNKKMEPEMLRVMPDSIRTSKAQGTIYAINTGNVVDRPDKHLFSRLVEEGYLEGKELYYLHNVLIYSSSGVVKSNIVADARKGTISLRHDPVFGSSSTVNVALTHTIKDVLDRELTRLDKQGALEEYKAYLVKRGEFLGVNNRFRLPFNDERIWDVPIVDKKPDTLSPVLRIERRHHPARKEGSREQIVQVALKEVGDKFLPKGANTEFELSLSQDKISLRKHLTTILDTEKAGIRDQLQIIAGGSSSLDMNVIPPSTGTSFSGKTAAIVDLMKMFPGVPRRNIWFVGDEMRIRESGKTGNDVKPITDLPDIQGVNTGATERKNALAVYNITGREAPWIACQRFLEDLDGNLAEMERVHTELQAARNSLMFAESSELDLCLGWQKATTSAHFAVGSEKERWLMLAADKMRAAEKQGLRVKEAGQDLVTLTQRLLEMSRSRWQSDIFSLADRHNGFQHIYSYAGLPISADHF